MDVEQYGFVQDRVLQKAGMQCIIIHDESSFIVAFRGTDNLENVITDVKFSRTKVAEMRFPRARRPLSSVFFRMVHKLGMDIPKAHTGFMQVYALVRDSLMAALMALVEEVFCLFAISVSTVYEYVQYKE